MANQLSLAQQPGVVPPLNMVPNQFLFRDALPKTSTAKIDYQRLVDAGAWTSP